VPRVLYPCPHAPLHLSPSPTRRSADLAVYVHALGDNRETGHVDALGLAYLFDFLRVADERGVHDTRLHGVIDSFERVRILSVGRSEEHTSELQSRFGLDCRLPLAI